MEYDVKKVRILNNYKLKITFENGKVGVFDTKPHLHKPYYRLLNNPAFFAKAQALDGTVVWSDEVDMAPELLYEECVFIKNE